MTHGKVPRRLSELLTADTPHRDQTLHLLLLGSLRYLAVQDTIRVQTEQSWSNVGIPMKSRSSKVNKKRADLTERRSDQAPYSSSIEETDISAQCQRIDDQEHNRCDYHMKEGVGIKVLALIHHVSQASA